MYRAAHGARRCSAHYITAALSPGSPISNVILLLLNNKLCWELKRSFAPFKHTGLCNYTDEFYIW